MRELRTVARAIDDVTLTDIESVSVNLAVGGTTVTLSAGDMTKLDLSIGDYILLEDKSAQAMINRVESLTSTVITLVIPSTVALDSVQGDPVHKLHQVEVELI